MDALYLICLLVGGFFVLLSLFGGDTDHDADAGGLAGDAHGLDAGHGGLDHHGAGSHEGTGLVDLLSLRTLFLFAAFFGLTGTLLSWTGTGEPVALLASLLTGSVVGLGGNYLIHRLGYREVSSDVTSQDLVGRTARVMIPFAGAERGKISLVTRGHRVQLLARSFEEMEGEAFRPGDEVVVVRLKGSVAEVVKPS